jgi:hypothetical protein
MQTDPNMFDILKAILQFAVLPLAGFMWAHYSMTQRHEKQIAVIQTEHALVKENHDREFKEVRESFKRIFDKLDEIQRDMQKK